MYVFVLHLPRYHKVLTRLDVKEDGTAPPSLLRENLGLLSNGNDRFHESTKRELMETFGILYAGTL